MGSIPVEKWKLVCDRLTPWFLHRKQYLRKRLTVFEQETKLFHCFQLGSIRPFGTWIDQLLDRGASAWRQNGPPLSFIQTAASAWVQIGQPQWLFSLKQEKIGPLGSFKKSMRAFSRKAQHAVSYRNGYIWLPKKVVKMDTNRDFGNI